MAKKTTLEIVRFWAECSLEEPPFVHPKDLATIQHYQPEVLGLPPTNFEKFIASRRFGDKADRDFHFSLLPRPYQGDLRRADIFLLQLNPGLNVADYRSEWDWPEFRQTLERQLRQDLAGMEFPFFCLNPKFCWHSGYRWWEGKLRDVAWIIAERKFQGRYLDALRALSQRLVVIELVPYHSVAFKHGGLIRSLESSQQAIHYVQTEIVRRAVTREITLIIARKVKAWGVLRTSIREVVTYPAELARGSSLSARSPGGQAILRRFGIRIPA
jgi:hypothetical protein